MCRYDLTLPIETDNTELREEDLQENEPRQEQEFYYHRYNPTIIEIQRF